MIIISLQMAHSLLGENIKNIQLLEFTLKGCAPDM